MMITQTVQELSSEQTKHSLAHNQTMSSSLGAVIMKGVAKVGSGGPTLWVNIVTGT